MAQGRLRKAVDKSIKSAVQEGRISLTGDAAAIGMLRYMADIIDAAPGESTVLRYATPASFLSYCQALGIAAPKATATKPVKHAEPDPDDEKVVPASTLEAFRAKHRRGA